jgi:hypothetical protein
MKQRFSALEIQITNTAPMEKWKRTGEFRPVYPALLGDELLVVSEGTKLASCVAGVRH